MSKALSAKLRCETILVSVSDAIQLRKTCHFPNQRAIRDLNTQRLGVEMEKGRFVQGTPVFLCVLPDGTQYIVNGNHTLEAIAYSGKPQLLTFVWLQVADFDEAAAVYASFDIHKARTWTDALKATGRAEKMPKSKEVSAAVKLIMTGFKYSPDNVEANSSRAANFEVMDLYEDAAGMLHDAMKGAPQLNQRIVYRSSVLAVALETVRYQPNNAVQFWGDLANDEGLVSGDPRKALLRWLLCHPAGKGHAGFLMSRACAHAWNAWWKNQEVNILRPGIVGKILLLGTPWDGRKGPDHSVSLAPAKKASGVGGPSVLSDIFETGMRATPDGVEPVVLYRAEEEQE
jgi:hypothetical protein